MAPCFSSLLAWRAGGVAGPLDRRHEKATAAISAAVARNFFRRKGSGRLERLLAKVEIGDLLGPLRAGLRLVVGGHPDIDRRQHEQREQRADRHAGYDDETDREAARRAGAGRGQQRDQAGDHRRRRHQDRTQPDTSRHLDCRALVETFLELQLVGELDHQNAVLGDEADQRQQSDLGIDVDGRHAEEQRDQGADDRHGNADHDHQRIAQAFELRRQHQEDDDQREAEGDRELIALLHILPGVGQIIVAETGGQLLRFALQEVHRLPDRHARHRHRREGRGVELVVVRQRIRIGAGLDRHDGRQRHQLPGVGRNIVTAERFRRQPHAARHLRDHLIRSSLEIEAVDVIAAQQRLQRGADLRHVDAEIARLGTVDGDAHHRLVEVEIAVGDDEQAALARGVLQLRHLVIDGLEAGGRIDHHLHRQAAGPARQRRQVERERLDAFDLGELRLHQRLQLDRGALALIPRLEQHAGNAALRPVDAVQDEAQVGLGKLLERLVELFAVEIDIVDVGVFRRLGHREHDALVLLGREFLGSVHIEEADQAEDRQREQPGDRTIVERAVELAAVPARHRAEHPVDQLGEPPFLRALEEAPSTSSATASARSRPTRSPNPRA